VKSFSVFQLLQWKYAIQLEAKGLRHSSGRSVRKHAATAIGIRPMASAPVVLDAIEILLTEARNETQAARDCNDV
jgi:hypothetical protein